MAGQETEPGIVQPGLSFVHITVKESWNEFDKTIGNSV
jgi:hypothetical protein